MESAEKLGEQQCSTSVPVFHAGGHPNAIFASEFEELRIPPPPKMAAANGEGRDQKRTPTTTATSKEGEPQEKRRRITMDPGTFLEYSNSQVGANPLKNPLSVKKSSRNINDILMPRKRQTSSGRVFKKTDFLVASNFPTKKAVASCTKGMADSNVSINKMKNSSMHDYFTTDSRNSVSKSPGKLSPNKNALSPKGHHFEWPVKERALPSARTHPTTHEVCLRTPPKDNTTKSSPNRTAQKVSPGSRTFKWPPKQSTLPFTKSLPKTTIQRSMSSPGKGNVGSHSSSPSTKVSPNSRTLSWPAHRSCESSQTQSQSGQMSTSEGSVGQSSDKVVRNIFGMSAENRATTTVNCNISDQTPSCSSSTPHDMKEFEGTSFSDVQESTDNEQQLGSFDDSDLDNLLANYNMDQCVSHQRSESSNTFGLFGVSHVDEDPLDDDSSNSQHQNPFEQLPVELLENIFCQLPMLDLCLHLSLVCRQWRDIIQKETFVPWKKKYHKLKLGCPETVQELNSMMGNHNITASKDSCLLQLIRYMSSLQKREEAAILDRLQAHPLSAAAQDLIRNRAADCLKDGACPAWSVVAAVVILSSSVSDVQTIIQLLTNHPTPCMVVDVLEGLYCIATLLFALRTHFQVNLGLHYRLYYALYLYENASSVSCGQLNTLQGKRRGQQSMMRYRSGKDPVRLSHEQLRIINHELKPFETIKIIAFAGTGKTTTLLEYTRLRPHLSFLLVAYNKSVKEHAAKVFPGNVVCKTVHSLAYKFCGYRYMQKIAPSVKTYDVAMNLPNDKANFVLAKFVADTLTSYIASAEDVVTTTHVPSTKVGKDGLKKPISHGEKMRIANQAQHIWDRMVDPSDGDVRITHDGYLKIYQLSRPQITDFDCLLIDEAQDLTPATIDILMRQDVAKILVGDPHQQIYTFRGAINAMHASAATHTYYLTQSFRFGPEIAYVAACMLNVLKGVKNKTLVGSSKPGNVMGTKQGQEAVICRLNSTLFNEAVRLTSPSRNCRIAFAGGIAGYGLDRILDIYYLSLPIWQRKKENVYIRDPFLRKFETLQSLKNFAEKGQDVELSGKIRTVETHRHDIPKYVKRIKERATKDMSMADVVLSTAHKAKGLEFDTVRLADDFCGASNPAAPDRWENMAEDEKNLLYVAATRAKKSLLLTSTVMQVLKEVQEQFIYPELTRQLVSKGVALTCTLSACGQDIPADNLIVMNRRVVTYGSGYQAHSGPLCPKCTKKSSPGFRSLLSEPAPGEGQGDDDELSDDDSNDGWGGHVWVIQFPALNF